MTREQLQERLQTLHADFTATREHVAYVEAEHQKASNRLQALHGARQECEHWLNRLDAEPVPKPDLGAAPEPEPYPLPRLLTGEHDGGN